LSAYREETVQVFKTKDFARFARRERIIDDALCAAIERAERGLIDADLGGGVIKQRVPRKGQGRSGGYRTLIAYRSGERSMFTFGFAKSDQDNISDDQLDLLKTAAKRTLEADAKTVQALLDAGE
jgi:hypothetical protein